MSKSGKTIRFGDDQMEQIEKASLECGMTVASFVRDACQMRLERQRLASDMAVMEQRLHGVITRSLREIISLQKDVQRVESDLHIVVALTNELSKFIFMTTPEVVDTASAHAVGMRRYTEFMSTLNQSLVLQRREDRVADALDDGVLDEGDDDV